MIYIFLFFCKDNLKALLIKISIIDIINNRNVIPKYINKIS